MYKYHGLQFSGSNRISVKDSEAKATQRFEGGTHSISHRTNDIRAHLESTIGRAIYQLLHPLVFGKKNVGNSWIFATLNSELFTLPGVAGKKTW